MGPEYDGPVTVHEVRPGVYLVSPAETHPRPPLYLVPPQWKCVDCGYTDTERSLICPNCATNGELMGGSDVE